VAEELAAALPQPVTYVATGAASDDAIAARIAAHRARRPVGWSTVELVGPGDAGAAVGLPDLAGVLADVGGVALVDSLGTWVASDPALDPDAGPLCAVMRRRTGDTVVVSEEVGLGVHAETAVGRRFADALGTVNRTVADAADRVLLVVAGRVLPLERDAFL
jgi:adenosylcobinamide kinase/adenosylcobinamide-phosphate guanylyltransferase